MFWMRRWKQREAMHHLAPGFVHGCWKGLEQLEPRLLLSGIQSDDFGSTALASYWQLFDPSSDAALVLDGDVAQLSVPSGTSHDIWRDGNDAPRLMQLIDDTDLSIEIKFESAPIGKSAMQGILIQQDEDDFLRFDFFSDGSKTKVFAASFTEGTPTSHWVRGVTSEAPLYMRITREGSTWTQSYSYDGTTWKTAGSFHYDMVVNQAGFFVGNASANPAMTASVDYFRNLQQSQPPDPEPEPDPDPPPPDPDTTAPSIISISEQAQATSLQIAWNTSEITTGRVQYGLTTAYELGSIVSDSTGSSHSVTLSNLQSNTTYYYRIIAVDLAQNTTVGTGRSAMTTSQTPTNPQAPVIDVWYGSSQSFGLLGTPQRWVNILGNVSDPDGVSTLHYSLNGESPQKLKMGPNLLRLERKGDFNVEIAVNRLRSGSNTVDIIAVDSTGRQTTMRVNVHYNAQTTWPMPYTTNWASAGSILNQAQVVDGHWHIEGDGIRIAEPGYDRLVNIGSMNWDDYEVVVPITVHQFNLDARLAPAVGIIAGWSGHYADGKQPSADWTPLGGLGWYEWNSARTSARLTIVNNEGATIARDTSGFTIEPGTTYIFKMQVESQSGGGSIYRLKVWRQGDPEPSEWNLIGQGESGELASGSIGLLAQHTDATFGNVSVRPLHGSGGDGGGDEDVTAPQISSQSHEVTASSITVHWTTSEATTGVVRYGKTVNLELGTVASSATGLGHQAVLAGLDANTTYYYRVIATDLAGNSTTGARISAQTSSASTPPPPTATGQSDEFSSSTLASMWNFINPRGDGQVGMTGSQLKITLPSNSTDHDLWKAGNYSARVMQTIENGDFDLVVKFDSQPTGRYAMQGILIEEGPGNYLRFDFYHDGSKFRIFAASFIDDAPTVRGSEVIAAGTPLYMRITRVGDSWRQQYSYDDVTWMEAATFSHVMSASSAGAFAGNSGANPTTQVLVDYFRWL